jgi:hypothetical protein
MPQRTYLEGREQPIETLKAGKSEALRKGLAAVAKLRRYSFHRGYHPYQIPVDRGNLPGACDFYNRRH